MTFTFCYILLLAITFLVRQSTKKHTEKMRWIGERQLKPLTRFTNLFF